MSTPVDDRPTEGLSVADLETLVRVSRELAVEINLDGLLPTILELASRLTGSGASSLILHDEERNRLYFAHATGPKADEVLAAWGRDSPRGVPVEGSKAGETFTTGKSIVVDALAADPTHFKGVDEDIDASTQSMVCVPLALEERRIGVVQLLNRHDGNYTEKDVALLEHFANQAAIAIRNARLFSDLLAHMGLYTSQKSAPDPLALLEMLRQPARTERLSIMFADMRGFTQLCHVTERPERTQELLNEFLGMLAREVLAQEGLVNKFLGDGVLALFRGPRSAERAVSCAFAMLDGFDAMTARWDRASNTPLSFLDLGIGIATGNAVMGSMGSERVRDFTAVGTAVNLAADLMEHARDGRRLLVDRVTFRAVADTLAEFEGPESYEFRKPGYSVFHPAERYHLKTLRREGGSPAGPPAPAVMAGAASAPRAGVENSSAHLFISYSHQDAAWLKHLQQHLRPYVAGGGLSVWDDEQIGAGARWHEEIERALTRARAAILLVSPSFLSSTFINKTELPALLSAAEERGLRILWVPVSASSYHKTEIARFQAAASPDRPLDCLSKAEQNQAWVEICKRIEAALES